MKRKDLEQESDLIDETEINHEPKLKQIKSTTKLATTTTATTEVMDEQQVPETNKSEKYDRQIRLWGVDGQKDLENANICLVNVTAVGTEILKCLVLPGIGKFTIIDKSNVAMDDLGSNFFLDPGSLGKSKAQSACELLQEMNPDTVGSFSAEDPMEMLERNPDAFGEFTVVICSRLSERDAARMGEVLWRLNVPLVVCDTFAFIGYMRLVVKQHLVVNAQPDNVLEDIRLDHSFPELDEYMARIDLNSMDTMEHSHTPYLVLLYKYLEQWKTDNNSNWPKSYAEKRQIRDLIRAGIRTNEDGVREDEENFEEAIKNCNSAFTNTRVPSEVDEILKKSTEVVLSDQIPRSNLKFWCLVKALKEFVDSKSVLPVRGTLPDMFSDSKRYIELQNIYRNIAMQDIQLMTELVKKIVSEAGLPDSFISPEDLSAFCKHAFFIRAMDGVSIHDEMVPKNTRLKEAVEMSLGNNNGGELYMVMRVLNRFCNSGRYPFTGQTEDSNDMQRLTTLSEQLIQELGVSMSVPSDYLGELMRSKLNEVHAVASIVGGMCAQEVIKVVTRQFVPVDNVLFFNGMNQTTSTLKL